jgi:hypothetical protein
MVSVASGGAADRIAARILSKVLRMGSGTPARYSSTLFGAPLPFAAEVRFPDFIFLIRESYKKFYFESMPRTIFERFDMKSAIACFTGVKASGRIAHLRGVTGARGKGACFVLSARVNRTGRL